MLVAWRITTTRARPRPYSARALDEHKRLQLFARAAAAARMSWSGKAAALGAVARLKRGDATGGGGGGGGGTRVITRMVSGGAMDTAVRKCIAVVATLGITANRWRIGQARELTRPEAISHFFRETFIGETKATTSFRRAGNRAFHWRATRAFAEQVAGADERLEPYLENLRPWEPKKSYYFPDAAAKTVLAGKARVLREEISK